MKILCVLVLLSLGLAVHSVHSQTAIPSYPLSVTVQKTTNLIFPYRIKMADIGSADITGHKDPLLENVLFLKANRKNFAPTNLSVYTSDGKFYSFIVQYKESPDTLNLSFSSDHSLNAPVTSINEARLDSDAKVLLNQPKFLHRKATAQEMKVLLTGIYIQDDLFWFRIVISNRSPIAYRPEYIKFFIRDKHEAKRTAVQETELMPTWKTPDEPTPGRGKTTNIFSFPVFTLDNQKKLLIQIVEKNGGRLLELYIPPKVLLKSQPITTID